MFSSTPPASMTSDGKLPETSPDTLDDASFSRESAAGLAGESAAKHDHASVTARRTGAPVASSADDELSRVPDLAPDFDEDAVLGRKRGLHVGAFVLVFLGAVLGAAAGYFALRQSASKETPALSASASASDKVVAAPTNSESAPVAIASTSSSAKTAPTSTVGARTASKDAAGFAGPNAPSVAGPSDQALAKGDLSAGEISGVVERNRPLIKRQCWQPEVAARQGMGGSARVTTSFMIGPSGAVHVATASGAENDYPGLAPCIARRIREWKFPASASQTPVNVPFVFAAQ